MPWDRAECVQALAEEFVDAFLRLEPGCSEEGMLELTREYLCGAYHSRVQLVQDVQAESLRDHGAPKPKAA